MKRRSPIFDGSVSEIYFYQHSLDWEDLELLPSGIHVKRVWNTLISRGEDPLTICVSELYLLYKSACHGYLVENKELILPSYFSLSERQLEAWIETLHVLRDLANQSTVLLSLESQLDKVRMERILQETNCLKYLETTRNYDKVYGGRRTKRTVVEGSDGELQCTITQEGVKDTMV